MYCVLPLSWQSYSQSPVRSCSSKSCWFGQWQWRSSIVSSLWRFCVKDLFMHALHTSLLHFALLSQVYGKRCFPLSPVGHVFINVLHASVQSLRLGQSVSLKLSKPLKTSNRSWPWRKLRRWSQRKPSCHARSFWLKSPSSQMKVPFSL